MAPGKGSKPVVLATYDQACVQEKGEASGVLNTTVVVQQYADYESTRCLDVTIKFKPNSERQSKPAKEIGYILAWVVNKSISRIRGKLYGSQSCWKTTATEKATKPRN